MNSDHEIYVEAEAEINRLINSFDNIRSLYEILQHLRGRYMTKETACKFYEAILDKLFGRNIDIMTTAAVNEDKLNYFFIKSKGLIVNYNKGELEAILREIERLKNCIK